MCQALSPITQIGPDWAPLKGGGRGGGRGSGWLLMLARICFPNLQCVPWFHGEGESTVQVVNNTLSEGAPFSCFSTTWFVFE